MARVKRGTKRRARRKKYLKRTKGFFLTKSKLYQSAQEAANRADRYAKRDRRVWPVDSRPQGCRRQSRPQNPSGYRGERRRGIHIARGDSESRRSTASQSEKSVLAKIAAPPSLSALFSRRGTIYRALRCNLLRDHANF